LALNPRAQRQCFPGAAPDGTTSASVSRVTRGLLPYTLPQPSTPNPKQQDSSPIPPTKEGSTPTPDLARPRPSLQSIPCTIRNKEMHAPFESSTIVISWETHNLRIHARPLMQQWMIHCCIHGVESASTFPHAAASHPSRSHIPRAQQFHQPFGVAQTHAWKMFDLPLQRGEFASASCEMLQVEALI